MGQRETGCAARRTSLRRSGLTYIPHPAFTPWNSWWPDRCRQTRSPKVQGGMSAQRGPKSEKCTYFCLPLANLSPKNPAVTRLYWPTTSNFLRSRPNVRIIQGALSEALQSILSELAIAVILIKKLKFPD